MNNNILIAQQGNCDVALIDGSKVFHYKDKSGNDQSLDLANLTDGTGLFTGNANLNVDWDASLPNLTNGGNMFYGSNLASFSGELPRLTKAFKSPSGFDMSYNGMFQNCTTLTSFSSDLPNLSDGSNMFNGCTGLTSFSGELPNLSKAGGNFSLGGMFQSCTSLTSWTVELPNLSDGSYMFSGCTGLTSWTADLPNLSYGDSMFENCSNLTSWTVELPNLESGSGMFSGCKLDKDSVHCIAESIPAISSDRELTLGIDASLQNDADVAADLATIETTKNWNLTTEWN